ncbi:16516_t:CDS:2 [Acaulospora morrowiae]|uniref:16516_t:CDS:1 n=1 Tax=Acaulospora morrowiae TaxID=94023 RepID=A0A9N9A2B1_9GLOM|nr:16516_t:CDS:2 [Acaulospora morrowiae]
MFKSTRKQVKRQVDDRFISARKILTKLFSVNTKWVSVVGINIVKGVQYYASLNLEAFSP